MITLIAIGLMIVFVILACINLICSQFDSDDLRKMGIGR